MFQCNSSSQGISVSSLLYITSGAAKTLISLQRKSFYCASKNSKTLDPAYINSIINNDIKKIFLVFFWVLFEIPEFFSEFIRLGFLILFFFFCCKHSLSFSLLMYFTVIIRFGANGSTPHFLQRFMLLSVVNQTLSSSKATVGTLYKKNCALTDGDSSCS